MNVKFIRSCFFMQEKSIKDSPNYKWIIVGLCFLMIFVCLGFCSSNKSLYLQPITSYLSISRTAFSIGDSIRFITTAIVNIFFGALVKKFGTKKLIVAGILSLSVATCIYSTADKLYWFYVAGAFLGLGFSWTTTTMVGCVVGRWCSEKKGTIMGAVLASNGIGAALSTQILSPIIYKADDGYRDAYRLTMFILLAVAVLMILFFKDKKSADGVPGKKKRSKSDWIGLDFSEAIKKPYFYATMVCVFLIGVSLQGVGGISAAHMKDVGITPAFIAITVSIHSLVLSASKFISGVMYDKFGLKVTALYCDLAAVVTMFALASISNSATGMVLAMTYGVVSSIALPLETIMLPIFAGDLFGTKGFEHMLGIFVSVNTTGYAVGGPLMNMVYEMTGSYKSILIVLGFVMIAVTVLFQFVIRAADRVKNIELER